MKKILAAVKDTSEFSREIVRIASELGKAESSELCITYVYEVPMSLPLDEDVPEELEKGDMILEAASEIAGEFAIPIETHIIQARTAASGIVNQIKDLNIDTVIMGIKHSGTQGEVLSGNTVEYVLKSAHCRVLLIRFPDEQSK